MLVFLRTHLVLDPSDSWNNRIRLVDCGGPCNSSLVFLNLSATMDDCDPTVSICLTDSAHALPVFSAATVVFVIALHAFAMC